jgi:hypothetical protein
MCGKNTSCYNGQCRKTRVKCRRPCHHSLFFSTTSVIICHRWVTRDVALNHCPPLRYIEVFVNSGTRLLNDLTILLTGPAPMSESDEGGYGKPGQFLLEHFDAGSL